MQSLSTRRLRISRVVDYLYFAGPTRPRHVYELAPRTYPPSGQLWGYRGFDAIEWTTGDASGDSLQLALAGDPRVHGVGKPFGGETRATTGLRNRLCRVRGEDAEQNLVVGNRQRHQQLHGCALMTHRRCTFLEPSSGVPQRRRRQGGPVPLHEVARQPWRSDTHRIDATDSQPVQASGVSLSISMAQRAACHRCERGWPPSFLD
jgi:hypothetical protein